MATTTNYAWTTPDDTALVTNGASAMRTLGSAIDATLGGQKNIKQIVSATYATATSNSTSTAADTGLTATITPSKSTNQVLAVWVQNGCGKQTNNVNLEIRLLRGATQLVSLQPIGGNSAATTNYVGAVTGFYLDSPATTAATTYKTTFLSQGNLASVTVQSGAVTSYLYLLEIGV